MDVQIPSDAIRHRAATYLNDLACPCLLRGDLQKLFLFWCAQSHFCEARQFEPFNFAQGLPGNSLKIAVHSYR